MHVLGKFCNKTQSMRTLTGLLDEALGGSLRFSTKNPFFKKVHDSLRTYASGVVPTRTQTNTPYDFAANYYWPNK